MANEIRVRVNFIGGIVDDNPLSDVATTLTSTSLSDMPLINTTNHAAIVLDPDGIDGNPEIVHVTAHGVGATTATVLRGQESTVARQHNQSTPWIHTATSQDFETPASTILAYKDVSGDHSTTSSSLTTIDAVNAFITFVVPSTGKVLVHLEGLTTNSSSGYAVAWGVRDATTNIIDLGEAFIARSNNGTSYLNHIIMNRQVTGLTPGASLTWYFAHRQSYGSGTVRTLPRVIMIMSLPA